jgi:5-carboxymethyl-2-hydroxymuconate isomerase
MPHITLEYTRNLPGIDAAALLSKINAQLAASGVFGEADIKSRAFALDVFAVGTATGGRGFVRVEAAILDGRTPEVKRALSAGLLQVLKDNVPPASGLEVQFSVEIRDMDRDSYAKVVVAG